MKKIAIHSNLKVFFIGLSFFFLFFNRYSIDFISRVTPLYFFVLIISIYLLTSKRDLKLTLHKFFIPFLGFFFYCALVSPFTIDPELTVRFWAGALYLTAVILIYIIFIDANAEFILPGLRFSCSLIIVTSLVLYIFGLLNFNPILEGEDIYGITIEKSIPRLIGINNDPNIAAITLIVTFWLILYSFTTNFRKLVGMLVTSILLIATLSRSGMAAFAFSIIIYYVAISQNRSRAVLKFLAFSTFLGLLLYFSYLFSEHVIEFDVNLFVEKRLSGLESGGGRFEIWENSLSLFYDYFIVGSGPFTFTSVYEARFGYGIFAHNSFIQVLVETGLIGFVLYFFANLILILQSFRLRVYSHLNFLIPINFAYFFSLVGLTLYLSNITAAILILNYYFYSIRHSHYRGVKYTHTVMRLGRRNGIVST